MTQVVFLSRMDPTAAQREIDRFPEKYKLDWQHWQQLCSHHTITSEPVIGEFGRILRRWQAARPKPMRRPKDESTHEPPFLNDLVEGAFPHLQTLRNISVRHVDRLTSSQLGALDSLWSVFRNLASRDYASCVGISKAIMLLTGGDIGPAFDSNVRTTLGLSRPKNSMEWLECLRAIRDDIKMFEDKHRISIEDLVAQGWAPIKAGRVYDMIAGPRQH